MKVSFNIEYSEEKSLTLKVSRNVDFKDVVEALRKESVLADISHPNFKKFPGQRVLVVKIYEYAYAVPYVISLEKKTIFLKTIYPNRKYTKKYIKTKK